MPHSRSAHLARGTLQSVIAEGLVLPAGLITAAFLARALGPDHYGAFMIAVSVTVTIEWAIISIFARAVVKVVSEEADWRPAAAVALRYQIGFGVAAGLGLWLAADGMARLLRDPALAHYFRLFSIEIPLLAAGSACRSVLTGRGAYFERAVATGVRSIARPILVILLVRAGLSVSGAILGSVLAAFVSTVVSVHFARIPVFEPGGASSRRLWQFAVPLFVLALSLKLLEKLGLLAITALGRPAEEAGWYAAAQGFSLAPGLFAMSFATLLLSSVSTASMQGDLAAARRLVRDGLRLVILLAPLVAMGAGAAHEIVAFVYGPRFSPAATLALPLLVATLASTLIAVASAALIAAGRATQASASLWPLVPLMIVALAFVVPESGGLGAAVVTAATYFAGAAVLLVLVRATWDLWPSPLTVLRSGAVSAAAGLVAYHWATPGLWLALKGVVLLALIGGGYVLLGEVGAREVRLLRALVARTHSDNQQSACLAVAFGGGGACRELPRAAHGRPRLAWAYCCPRAAVARCTR